ncbi:MAG TPA: glycosyltransferase [Acidimicrobiales bacterium]|nr:glycosyltransferase [Acidimicrobiales bacterium]
MGTYPPTACGLATFTSNLRAAIEAPGWNADVVRVVDRAAAPASTLTSGAEVVGEWLAGDLMSLARSLRTMATCDAVLLQHEYGLFGGPDGEEVLSLVHGVDAPLVAVVHTALLSPSAHQRRILEEIMAASAVVVVQSESAQRRLVEVHGIDHSRVVVVPHGAEANFSPLPPLGRSQGGLPKVLTWGLLGPGKGIEYAIAAVAELRRRGIDATYLIAGQTHPKVRTVEGERYRDRLAGLARELGLEDRVRFDDTYKDWETLRAMVRSADVILLPYDSTDQVSSGVLVEALASARPVVATRFPHAEELLAGGAGLVVAHRDATTMTDALETILTQPAVAEAMAAAAQQEARRLLWPAVGAAYRCLIEELVAARQAG